MSNSELVNILIVDDREEDLLSLETILSDLGENIIKARSGVEAMRCLIHQDFAVILLDVSMPFMDGFEVAGRIRERPRSEGVPIIFITGIEKEDSRVLKGYSLGAVDYMFKPIISEVLKSKVKFFIEMYRLRKNYRLKVDQLETLDKARKVELMERRRMEEVLRESEARFRSIVELSSDWIWTIDLEGKSTYNNPALEVILGYTPGELSGKESFQFMADEDQLEVGRKLPVMLAEKRGWKGWIIRWRHKNGSIRWLESNADPLFDRDGELIGYLGIDRDITERKQIEEERERLFLELRDALTNIKQLKGLLPICASCKMIRNDKGYWQQVESYLLDHSDAVFSHGICPDCMKKLYPEFSEE